MRKVSRLFHSIRRTLVRAFGRVLHGRELPPDPFGLPATGGNGESDRVKNLLIRTTGKDPSVP